MAQLYFRKLKEKAITFDEVKPRWRDAVVKLIEKNGYVLNDDGTISLAPVETEN